MKQHKAGCTVGSLNEISATPERNAFHASGVLEAHIAQTNQALSAYESQYAVYTAARDTMINARRALDILCLLYTSCQGLQTKVRKILDTTAGGGIYPACCYRKSPAFLPGLQITDLFRYLNFCIFHILLLLNRNCPTSELIGQFWLPLLDSNQRPCG